MDPVSLRSAIDTNNWSLITKQIDLIYWRFFYVIVENSNKRKNGHRSNNLGVIPSVQMMQLRNDHEIGIFRTHTAN